MIKKRPPNPEMLLKMQIAIEMIADQNERIVKCPLCSHNAIIVFEDTRGHVRTKCKKCNEEIVLDVMNMRKLKYAI